MATAPTFPKPDAVKTVHKRPYAAISPLRPELSQEGRVVYVTGASAGIGLAICHAFGLAGAATIILTGRREGPLDEAVKALSKDHPNTKFIGQVLDAADRSATEKAWAQLDSDGIVVDVLVLNAARLADSQATMMELGYDELWPSFVTNVGANLDLIDRFYHQKKRAAGRKLVSCTHSHLHPRKSVCIILRDMQSLINISTMAIHEVTSAKSYPGYSTTKNAGTLTVQMIAQGVLPDDMQVLSFHPGVIYTASVANAGVPKDAYAWDDSTISP